MMDFIAWRHVSIESVPQRACQPPRRRGVRLRARGALAYLLSAITLAASGFCPGALAGEVDNLKILGCIKLADLQDPDQAENLSGAALTADARFLLLATDEGSQLNVLKAEDASFVLSSSIQLGKPDDEVDMEAITRHGDAPIFFVVGSHSWRRKSIQGRHADKTYKKLKERFEDESPDPERDRDRLVRLELDPLTGQLVGDLKELPIREFLNSHKVLKHFSSIPSKENGIDIEGIASDGEKLYLGFRGPVFRFGLAPVVVVAPDGLPQADLKYVPLDGRGIRDLAHVSSGFLIIAGPVGDARLPFQLYHWDGEDGFPGRREEGDAPSGRTELLGTIPTPPEGKAEALVVLKEEDNWWDLLVLYDGPAGGSPACFRVAKPSG